VKEEGRLEEEGRNDALKYRGLLPTGQLGGGDHKTKHLDRKGKKEKGKSQLGV